MADHTPRLCIECGRPLAATEKRLKYPWLCAFHRMLFEMRTSIAGAAFWS